MAALLSFIGGAVLQWRLFDLQVIRHEAQADTGKVGATRNIVWQADRGVILDRNQRLLLWNTEKESIVAHPAKVEAATEAARALEPLIGIPYETLLKRLESDKDEIFLKRHVPVELAPKISQLGLAGIDMKPEPYRHYVKGQLAGQVLGFVNIDNKGQGGIEKSEETRLAGKSVPIPVRPYGDRKAILKEDYMRGVPLRGADVVLTIDETIQWISENALYEMCEGENAKAGMAVVMDPHTGEVLAMANYPAFQPDQVGDYAQAGQMDRAKNHCITDVYEPGSTMKPFVAAAGLDCGAITPDTLIDCEGGRRYLPAKFRKTPIKDEHNMGRVPVTEVIVHSSNVGIGKIAEKIVHLDADEPNRRRLYNYWSAFGFGQKTGIELPGETPMFLYPWSKWNLNDMLVMAFGTGPVMVSPIGLAGAYCVLANGGWKVRPHIVEGYLASRHGNLYASHKDRGERVVSEEAARQVCDMLVQVVDRGTGTQAKSDWYKSGGKTGTAKKVVGGSYSQSQRVLSFAGFAPADPPKIVVVVMIDEPENLRFGGQAAAPVFRRIVDDTLAYLHVPPDGEGPQPDTKRRTREEPKTPLKPPSPVLTPRSPSPLTRAWSYPKPIGFDAEHMASEARLDRTISDRSSLYSREADSRTTRRNGQ